jgi:hypothetical protein
MNNQGQDIIAIGTYSEYQSQGKEAISIGSYVIYSTSKTTTKLYIDW